MLESHVPRRWEPTRPGVDIHRRQEMLTAIGACQDGEIPAITRRLEEELTETFEQSHSVESTLAAVVAQGKKLGMPVTGAHFENEGRTIVLDFPPEYVMTPVGFG